MALDLVHHGDRFLKVVRKPPSTKEAKNLATKFAVIEYYVADSELNEWYDLSDHYFRFMFTESVERTNNHSV